MALSRPGPPHPGPHGGAAPGLGGLAHYAGPPRSLIWRGGAAHLRAQAPGARAPDLHAHFGIQLTVGCGGPVQLRRTRAGAQQGAPGWLVGSDQPHWLHAERAAATLFYDPLDPDGRRLGLRLGAAGCASLTEGEGAAVREVLESCWERGWRLTAVRAAAHSIADGLAADAGVPAPVDPRVQAVVDILGRSPAEGASLAELAAAVGLSESRLAHLFRRDVGLPMRQYRLALRMEQALRAAARGSSLTQAAHEAGFADSAHLARMCRRMYGSAPSHLPETEVGA
jgi:AraC-like DNA-binding protein